MVSDVVSMILVSHLHAAAVAMDTAGSLQPVKRFVNPGMAKTDNVTGLS